jgi:hypothetical protein
MLIRTLVDGQATTWRPRTRCRMASLLKGPAGGPVAAYAARDAKPADYFATARALLASDPAPAADLKILRRTAPSWARDRINDAAAPMASTRPR